MHILHIPNDFIATKVHVSLFKETANQGVKQTIYCPIRHTSLVSYMAEHGYTYGKATYTEKAVYPVSADIPQGSLKVMDEHIEIQRVFTRGEFRSVVLFTVAVPLRCFRQTG